MISCAFPERQARRGFGGTRSRVERAQRAGRLSSEPPPTPPRDERLDMRDANRARLASRSLMKLLEAESLFPRGRRAATFDPCRAPGPPKASRSFPPRWTLGSPSSFPSGSGAVLHQAQQVAAKSFAALCGPRVLPSEHGRRGAHLAGIRGLPPGMGKMTSLRSAPRVQRESRLMRGES